MWTYLSYAISVSIVSFSLWDTVRTAPDASAKPNWFRRSWPKLTTIILGLALLAVQAKSNAVAGAKADENFVRLSLISATSSRPLSSPGLIKLSNQRPVRQSRPVKMPQPRRMLSNGRRKTSFHKYRVLCWERRAAPRSWPRSRDQAADRIAWLYSTSTRS